MIPGSVREVLRRLDRTNINSTPDTTGMAKNKIKYKISLKQTPHSLKVKFLIPGFVKKYIHTKIV